MDLFYRITVFYFLIIFSILLSSVKCVQFPPNHSSDISAEEKPLMKENKTDLADADESGPEIEIDIDNARDQKFLDNAMKKILDPTPIVINGDELERFRYHLKDILKDNTTLTKFIEEMDNLSEGVCKLSQHALWSYVIDSNSEEKKTEMIKAVSEEDEIRKEYWSKLKSKFSIEDIFTFNKKLKRKIQIIRKGGINVLKANSEAKSKIESMQQVWSRAIVCQYNNTRCSEDSYKTMGDIISIFRTSNDSQELSYYWKGFHDATGNHIRPMFKGYVNAMNKIAKSEDFKDTSALWQFAFEDENFVGTVDRIWNEVKPLYNALHSYVRTKLTSIYQDEFNKDDNLIPAHLLGNIWAQEWQSLFPQLALHSNIVINKVTDPKQVFEVVDQFYQSLGFESARESYEDINNTVSSGNCLPSSHDLCDGKNFKIKWCGDPNSDVISLVSRAARLLGHVQYFKQYSNLSTIYRDGPNPAFHDAISDIASIQVTSVEYWKTLGIIDFEMGPNAALNHLLWLSLEKIPMMGYAYVLDKWRWSVFENPELDNYNQYWWDLRIRETKISPPVPRSEMNLDPAAKYHVVSHVQYITYLISHVLEFQILHSLCKNINHTGPLHECNLYGSEKAGKLLRAGMSLGASEDWRTVLNVITGETELSTEGILKYFEPLKAVLMEASSAPAVQDMSKTVPIVIGIIALVLITIMVVMLLMKKYNFSLGFFKINKNGSLDIASNGLSENRNESEGVSEHKV